MMIWIVTGFLAIASTVFTVIPYSIMGNMVDGHVEYRTVYNAEDHNLEATQIFVTTEDGLKICAYEVAVEQPRAVVICLSGIHGPSPTVYFGHAKMFAERGIATVIVEMRSHGESEGNKIYAGYKEWLDVKAAVEYIKAKEEYRELPIVVYGVSMGAATAIVATGRIPDIDGVVSISAFSSWEDVFYDNMKQQVPTLIAYIEKPFIPIASTFKFGTKSWQNKPKKMIKQLNGRPALLMHTRQDSQVPYISFEKLLKVAPKHIQTSVRDGDKLFFIEDFEHPEEDAEYALMVMEFLQSNFLKTGEYNNSTWH